MATNTLALTVREIIDIAKLAGITLDEKRMPTADDMETEITIGPCPESGLRDEEHTTPLHYPKIAWFTEYPEEGSVGIGKQILPNTPDETRGH